MYLKFTSAVTFIFLFLVSTNVSLSQQRVFYNSKILDINNIRIISNNIGEGYWGRWFSGEWEDIVFSEGLFFIGKIDDSLHLAEILWGSLFSPGPIIDNQPAIISHPEDSLKYRVYKITKGDSSSSNIDVKEWPLNFGAPVTQNKRLKLYADQMLWTSYNALNVKTRNYAINYPPTPIEVHQTSFAYGEGAANIGDFPEDVVFYEYTIINKGNKQIDSAYLGLWTDINFNRNIYINFPGVDTLLQLGYCWGGNSSYLDSTSILAVGFVQLYGPAVLSPGSSAVFKGELKEGYRNLNITAFWGVHDDTFPDTSAYGPAYSRNTAWNIARGLDKTGRDIIDPYTNQKTTFRYAGDPVTGTGWLSNYDQPHTGGGAGFYMFSGPFNLAPNDTQWVMYALLPAKRENNLKSIIELRRRASVLKSSDYNDLVKFSEIKISDSLETIIPAGFKLLQNYPNPFNSGTTIKFEVPVKSIVRIDLFDVLGQKVSTLLESEKDAGQHFINFNPEGLSSGIYFYRMRTDVYSSIMKMVLLR
jgi:hypothetical protein